MGDNAFPCLPSIAFIKGSGVVAIHYIAGWLVRPCSSNTSNITQLPSGENRNYSTIPEGTAIYSGLTLSTYFTATILAGLHNYIT